MNRRIVFTALALLVATSCVSKGKYNTLKQELEDTQTLLGGQLDERAEEIKTLEQALTDEQAIVAKLETEIAEKKKVIAALEAVGQQKDAEIERVKGEQSRLEGELAAVIKDRSRLKASAAEMKQALKELSQRKAQADARVAEYRSLLTRFKEMIDAGKLRVTITDGRMVLALPSDVLFDSGKAKLSDDGKAAIIMIATVLETLPGRRFQVEGHTDNVPIKTARYKSNWDLAAARAIGVVKAMTEQAGMDGSLVSAASFGEFRPVVGNDTKDGRTLNRRIEIVLVPDLSTLPGFDALKKAVEGG